MGCLPRRSRQAKIDIIQRKSASRIFFGHDQTRFRICAVAAPAKEYRRAKLEVQEPMLGEINPAGTLIELLDNAALLNMNMIQRSNT